MTTTISNSFKSVLVGTIVTTVCASAFAQVEQTHTAQMSAQPLNQALAAFAKQTGLQLIYVSQAASGLDANAVPAGLEPPEALKKLLEGTGLRFEFLNERTVRIFSKTQAVSSFEPSAETPNVTEQRLQRLAQADTSSAGSAASGQEPAGKNASETTPGESQLEEVVVTAQRRQESLRETPISIAVLSGQKLDASTSNGLAAELNLIPGVAINKYGQAEGVQVVIRGVATAALFSGSSNVSYYVDGAPFGMIRQGIAPDLTPYDLERVEVLRGPQGTLYGAGAMAGAVNILTHDPDLDAFDLKMRTLLSSTEGGGLNYGGDVAINIPILPGRLGIRAVVSEHEDAGWIDAPVYGEEDRNDTRRSTYRLRIGAQPTDELTLDFSTWLSRSRSDAPALSRDNQQNRATFDEPIDVEYDHNVFTVGYDFQSFSLTSVTSYLDYQLESILDLTATNIPAFAGKPLTTNFYSQALAQEINLTSTTDGPWSWTAGVFYRDNEEKLISITPVTDNNYDYTSESYAVFGELTRSFSDDRLRFTVGLRYFDDAVTFNETKPFDFNTARPLVTGEDSFEQLTGRAVLTWIPTDELTMYASYAQGYRSGLIPDALAQLNFQGTAPSADPDSLDSYEIGAKGSAWNGRLHFDTAVYYIDWQNYRSSVPVVFNGLNLGYLGNYGQASGFGAEGALSVEVYEGLTFGVNVGWSGVELDSYNTRPDDAPEWTAGTSIDYSFPLGGNELQGVFSASANYQSEKKTAVGGATGNTFTDPYFFARASFTVNGPDHWSLSLFADNITDEYSTLLLNQPSRPDWDVRQRPRTIGLSLSYRY